MKKILAIVLVLGLLFASAMAEELYAPPLEERLMEVAQEDFIGIWEMYMCTSGKPVDMRSYYFVTIDSEGHVVVDHGNSAGEVWYETEMPQVENGALYIADANGENGAYYFLFDEGLMGCADTMENPDTIRYMECVLNEPWSETSWREESSAAVLSEVGEVTPVMAAQDCIGTWKCWATTTAEMGQIILDPAVVGMTMDVTEQDVTMNTWVSDETEVQKAALETSEQGVSFYSENDDASYWFFLRGEDEMVLLDDPEMPVAVMYFYTPERWAQEEANGAFKTGPELTDPVALTAVDQVAGQWDATHSSFLGFVETVDSGTLMLEINQDGSVVLLEEDCEPLDMTARVQDGYLIVEDGEGYYWRFQLYANDILVQALNGDDFSLAIYFQRGIEE